MMEIKRLIEDHYAKKKLSLYEKITKVFSFVPFPIPKNLRKRLSDEIEFTHLKITPENAFRSSINLPLILFLISFLLYFFGLIDFGLLIVLIATCFILFYFLFNYTKFYSFYFRSKASSEMVLSILYMSIALKSRPNLENAVYYAAENLTGPLGLDFKKGLYDLYTKKKLGAEEVIDEIAKKWRIESAEFVGALELIKGGVIKGGLEKNLERALELINEGTIRRMESYAYKMKTPLTIVTAFGVTLPLMLLVTLPIFLLFLPQIASPQMIAVSYDVVLPFVVFILLFQNLFRRPFSFHQPKVIGMGRIRIKSLLISFALGVILCSLLIYLLTRKEIVLFDETQFVLSLLLTFSLTLPFIIYNFIVFSQTLKLSSEIIQMEEELPEALSILASELKYGKPVEKCLEDFVPKLRETKIREFFKKVVDNLKMGLLLEDAIFDEKVGVIKKYPSAILNMVMRVSADIAKRGSAYLSSALDDLSSYLTKMKDLDFKVKEILSEMVHEIRMHSLVVAPLTAGIIVGLTIFVLAIFFFFRGSITGIKSFFEQYGVAGSAASFGFLALLNLEKIVPASIFQLIVGIYLIELNLLLSYFYNEIMFGEGKHLRSENTFKTLLITIPFYIGVILLIYFGINSFINMKELARVLA